MPAPGARTLSPPALFAEETRNEDELYDLPRRGGAFEYPQKKPEKNRHNTTQHRETPRKHLDNAATFEYDERLPARYAGREDEKGRHIDPMKFVFRASFALLVMGCACFAQLSQAPATPDQLEYFRFMLMNVASLDHSADAVRAFEDSLVKQFALNAEESAAIHVAGQSLKALLTQLRQSSRQIMVGKSVLSATDVNALSDLTRRREQMIETLANQILNSVRPLTATRLRTPGQILAGAVRKTQGVN